MASLYDLLLEAGVQATFADKLREDGWTVELFGMAAASLDKFDDELKDILGDLHDITTAVQRSAFRLAWTRCQTNTATPSASMPAPNATSSDSASAPSSWSETFPPKLTAQIVTELKQRFRKHYPAEVLLPETTPSLRLLSLVHHQKSKSEFRWVPWKYRLSQFKADELSSAKPTRMAKTEGLQLHALLVDTPPELTIENGSMGMHALRQTFETFSYAMAMVELAHLATLKNYYLRFINLMTTKMDSETGLRNPTILEAQSADKTLMTIACDLVMEKGWTFDDALHEVTFIRAEINTLLQARPRLPKQTYQRLEVTSSKGAGKIRDQAHMARASLANLAPSQVAKHQEKLVGSQKRWLMVPRSNCACDFKLASVIWAIIAAFIMVVHSRLQLVKLVISRMEHYSTIVLLTDNRIQWSFRRVSIWTILLR